MRRFLTAALTAALLCALLPAPSRAAAGFSDVPADSWAAEAIADAAEMGLMNGVGGGAFGYGKPVTRAEFVTILCRMFGWEPLAPEAASYPDVAAGAWYYAYVEAALAHGVTDSGAPFDALAPIRRADMAVMLVRALGYGTLAGQVEKFAELPFADVTADRGAIAIARDIGMINGVDATTFAPERTATREQAAAMLTRVALKYTEKLTWLHGFYAISSYSQRYAAEAMDAVSLGWSAMLWDEVGGARLSTGGGVWSVPDSYADITEYLDALGVPAHLNVYMDASAPGNPLRGLLARPEAREEAVAAILTETARAYDAIGKSPYSGVTVDFEGLRAADRANFTAFLTRLSAALRERGLALAVTVQPATIDRVYHDGYDYRAIGALADRVILMAHNYAPTALDAGMLNTQWQKNMPVTPIAEVYRALQAVTDPVSGVEDRGKLALALSFSPVGWYLTEDGGVASPNPVYPSNATVAARLAQADAVPGWSEAYGNPYLEYTTEDGARVFLWYEDAVSVAGKLALARLFGVTGASVWRIGLIPDLDGYDAWRALKGMR
jgi:hypothetical protein